MISPKNVISNVENINAVTPANIDSGSNVKRTFTATFAHRIVVRRKFESSLSSKTLAAFLFFFEDSILSLSLLILKQARLRPDNIPACVIQINIPIQMINVILLDSYKIFILIGYQDVHCVYYL